MAVATMVTLAAPLGRPSAPWPSALWPGPPRCPAARSAGPHPRRRRARAGLRFHPRRTIRPGRRRAAPRLRPGAARGLRRALRDRAVVAHPARSPQPLPGRRVQHRPSTGRFAQPKSGRSARRTTPRHGSTSGARTPPACNGVCCAKNGWPRRATASGSSRRSNGRSSSAPGLEDAYFGIGLYQYYADVAPTAAKVLRFFLMLPGGDKTEGLAQMLRARERRPPAPRRGGLPAPPHLPVVRAAAGAGARAAARPAEALPGQSALSCADRRHPGHLPARRDRQSRHLACAAGARARAARQSSRRSRKCRRGSASPGSSRSSSRPITRSSCSRVWCRGVRRRRTRRWPWRICDSARRTIGSDRAQRR